MALRVPKAPTRGLFKNTFRDLKGVDAALLTCIDAVCDVAKVLRTSFGPNGRKKLIQNHLEKLFVTSDAATVMRELEIAHPAAKLMMMASQSQDAEMGDATNLVNILIGEFLNNAKDLLRIGIHPSEIVNGYEIALEKCLEILDGLVVSEVKDLQNEDNIFKIIRPVLSSKQLDYNVFLSLNIAPAIKMVMPENPREFSVDSIRVAKVLGGSLFSSSLVNGMVFNNEPEGIIKRVKKAKIAIFSCPLDITNTEAKGTVLLRSADELLNFSSGEEDRMDKLFEEFKKMGINVIVTGSSMGALPCHFCNRHDIMVMKVPSKFNLRRLSSVVGANILLKVELPRPEDIGKCDEVDTVEIGSDRCTVFKQDDKANNVVTIVLRGSTRSVLDDVERAIDDSVNTIKIIAKHPSLVAGAGACELEIARRMYEIASKTPGLEQYAIEKFAKSLEAIPRILAENAGLDATEAISKLYVEHEAGNHTVGVVQKINSKDQETRIVEEIKTEQDRMEVEEEDEDEETKIMDSVKTGILDLLAPKKWAIKTALETSLTILRVNQIIMSKPAGGPKIRDNKGWDNED